MAAGNKARLSAETPRRRPHAARKPKWYHPGRQGTWCRWDTLDGRPWPGTARTPHRPRSGLPEGRGPDFSGPPPKAPPHSSTASSSAVLPIERAIPQPQRPRRKKPGEPTLRSSTRSPPPASAYLPAIAAFATGSPSTIPKDLTRPWATSPPFSSWKNWPVPVTKITRKGGGVSPVR